MIRATGCIGAAYPTEETLFLMGIMMAVTLALKDATVVCCSPQALCVRAQCTFRRARRSAQSTADHATKVSVRRVQRCEERAGLCIRSL